MKIPFFPPFMLLILLMILIPAKAPSKDQEQDQEHEHDWAVMAPFSVGPLSLPRRSGFRHPSPPYAFVSPNGQSANQKAGLGGRAFSAGEREFAGRGR
jgi:hypothetical protein